MAGLLESLLSGRSSDIYGAGLLTPEQRGGIGNIGLLALAGKLGQLAGPSFSPVPDFGAALGQAAGAYGASQEGAGTAALNAILTGQKGRKLEQELDYYKQLGPILGKLGGDWPGAGGGTGGGEGSGSTGGAAAPPGAGGGGGPGSDPRGMIPHITAEATRLGIDPAVALQVARSEGLGIFSGDGGKSGGAFQLYTGGGMGNDFIRDTGLDPLDPKNEKATITYALEQAAQKGWGAWNGAKKLGITGFTGIGKPGGAATAAAPDAVRVPYNYGAPSGGLLAPTAPNPLSDAEPMLPIARPAAAPGAGAAAVAPNQVGRFAGVAPGTPVNSRGFPYNPEITDPAVAARVAQSMAAIRQAQQSGVPWAAPRESSGGGGLLATPQDPNRITVPPPAGGPAAPGNPQPGDMVNGLVFKGGDPKDPRSWAVAPRGAITPSGGGLLAPEDPGAGYGGGPPQGPAGDPGPAGPATPRAPLPTMGPAGIELPPMQGPLAVPAPAAAVPAAVGPGLLAAPGALPAAPALPRVNPAYDAYARNLAVAAGLAKGAGLPDALGPLLEAFKGSPGYKAQQIIAEKGAAQPFEQAQTLFNKQVEIAGVGPIEAAKLPYALAKSYFDAEQQIRTAGPVAAAQNFERIKADNAAKSIITTKDADGNIKLAIDPEALRAVSGAAATIAGDTTRAQEQAKADVAAGTAPGIAQTTEEAKGIGAQNVAARQTALAAREGLVLLDESRDQLQGAGIFSGIGAGAKATVAQALSSLGFSNEKLANTQVFLQQAGVRTAEILRSGTYGTGTAIGATDLRAADKLANGDNTVEIEAIKRIFALAEQKMRRSIDTNNDIARMRKNPEQAVEHPPRFLGYVTGPDGKPQKAYQLNDGSKVVRE